MSNKYKHVLSIEFSSDDLELVIDAPSEFRKNCIDHLSISKNCIQLVFERAKRLSIDDCMLNANGTILYQVQRALCIYLAIFGSICEVVRISLSCNNQTETFNQTEYVKNWKDCTIKITISPEIAKKLLLCAPENKRMYIALTYFLKAQLDRFSADRFRAVWSGLNGIYNGLGNHNDRESDKLHKLASLITDSEMPLSISRIALLSETCFWSKLQWYNYVSNHEKIKDELYKDNFYRDTILYKYLTKYLNGLSGEEEQIELNAIAEKRMRKKKKDLKQRIVFLTCEYSYMLRNRSFHAACPYPVFSLNDVYGNSPQDDLTELLLYVICDMFETILNK